MNIWLAYQVALGVGLAIALAWAFDARRTYQRILKLARLRHSDLFDPPTEEIELPPTMRIGPRLEEFGPAKPLPPDLAA